MRRSPVDPVIGAVVSALSASTSVTGLATGGVYNNVPQGTPYPYVVVTSPTDRREDTFGRLGNIALVDVKAVSAYFGDQEAADIQSACRGVLDVLSHGTFTTTGHTVLGLAWESGDRFSEVVNGVQIRHHVDTYRAWTEQTTT